VSFENRFAFSFSSYAQFQRCRREWALHRMRAWNGWLRDAPEERQVAYRATKMTGYSRLAGDLIHDIALGAVAGRIRTPPAAVELFHSRWRVAVEASRREGWRTAGPKKVPPLFEHYYGTADSEHAARVVGRAIRCIENLFALPELEELRRAPLLQMEELERFFIRGLMVWAKPDLAYWQGEIGDGWLHIWDWKTGREKDADRVQVLLYALFGHHRWGAAAERTRLVLGYLWEPCVEEILVGPWHLEELEGLIWDRASEMRACLPDPDVITDAPLELFPRTTELETCQGCDFFHACKGHRDLSRPEMIVEGFE
jgi:hypothetical protein